MMTFKSSHTSVNIGTNTSQSPKIQSSQTITPSPAFSTTAVNSNSNHDPYRDTVTITSSSKTAESSQTYDHLGSQAKRQSRQQDIMQTILDKRTGIDRDKLDEIEAQIQEVAKNNHLSQAQKEEQIALLEEQKTQMMEEFIEINELNQRQFNVQEQA